MSSDVATRPPTGPACTPRFATIIRRTEIHSVNDDFPIIAPFTTIAAEPIPARVKSLTASGP
jgi:hypothetical protein